eukprot:4857243-Prymnesium_polylepis.1
MARSSGYRANKENAERVAELRAKLSECTSDQMAAGNVHHAGDSSVDQHTQHRQWAIGRARRAKGMQVLWLLWTH